MKPRWLIDTGGPLLGLLFVAIMFAALIGPRFFSAGERRADRPPDGDRLRRGARHDDDHRVWRHRSVGRIGRRADDGRRRPDACARALAPSPAALAGVAAAALCGLVNGVLITALRVVPFIVTLGTMILVRGAAKGLAEERRIEAPATWLNELMRAVGPDEARCWLPAGIWIVALLALLVATTLGYTRFGRHLFAIGSNERTARLCGVPSSGRRLRCTRLARCWPGSPGCCSSRGSL